MYSGMGWNYDSRGTVHVLHNPQSIICWSKVLKTNYNKFASSYALSRLSTGLNLPKVDDVILEQSLAEDPSSTSILLFNEESTNST